MVGVAKQGRFGGKITISVPVATQGLDLATADAYANLRVIQNTTSSFDKHLYIGYLSGATSHVYLYSNNLGAPTVKVEGANLGIGMSPHVGGGNTNNIQISNGVAPTGFAGMPGGTLYVNAGRLFYIGSAGTVTLLAPV